MLPSILNHNALAYTSYAERSAFLKYATVSGVVPPLGLRRVKVVNTTSGDTIHASTCINTIIIPKFDDFGYEPFKSAMDSIISSEDFLRCN